MLGFQEIVLSVFNIARIAEPMVKVGGFTLIPLPDAPKPQFSAWHTPAACTRIEQALLVPAGEANDKGYLRVVAFHDVPKRVMRSSQRTWDTGGIFDIDVFSKDVNAVYGQLQAFGWTAFGDPVDYEEGEFDVRQVVAIGPDGLMVAIIQPHKSPTFALPSFEAMSRVFNSTQLVRDYERAKQFYCDTLGWKLMVEFGIDNQVEPGASVLGLPLPYAKSANRQVGIVHPGGVNDGSVELIQNKSMQGKDFSAHCVAPNVGLLSLRFPVEDARGYAQDIVGRGGELYTAPTKLEIAPYGMAELFSVRTPDGAILEFYQRLD